MRRAVGKANSQVNERWEGILPGEYRPWEPGSKVNACVRPVLNPWWIAPDMRQWFRKPAGRVGRVRRTFLPCVCAACRYRRRHGEQWSTLRLSAGCQRTLSKGSSAGLEAFRVFKCSVKRALQTFDFSPDGLFFPAGFRGPFNADEGKGIAGPSTITGFQGVDESGGNDEGNRC